MTFNIQPDETVTSKTLCFVQNFNVAFLKASCCLWQQKNSTTMEKKQI